MSSEKLQILKMLEEGKITADDAARLLQAAGADDRPRAEERPYAERPRTSYDERPRTSYDGSSASNNRPAGGGSGGGGGSRGFSGFEDFAGDLGRKFETLARDMEPKIQKFVGVVAEKTSDVADRISRNMSEAEASRSAAPPRPEAPRPAPVQREPGRSPGSAAAPSPAAAPRSFELTVDPGYNELSLMALNGDISVNGYNGDKITVRVYAKERRGSARLELMRLGSRYYLSYDEEDFKSVSIEALVPERMFNSAVLGAEGGQTEITNLSAEYFTVQSSNGAAILRHIRSDNIKVDTSNGRISLEDVAAQNAHIEGSNGAIDANYIDVANLRLITSNSAISMNAADFRQASDYTWIIETSNGKIALNVPSSPRTGYHVKASTSLGNVRVGLPALNYMQNSPNSIEARSSTYDSAACRVKLSVETSGAGLSIN